MLKNFSLIILLYFYVVIGVTGISKMILNFHYYKYEKVLIAMPHQIKSSEAS